jgi:molecular chaperone DnaK
LQLEDDVQGELDNVGIVDVNAHSLGIAVYSRKQQKRVNAILIPKNQQLPCAQSQVFPLRHADTRSVRVMVLEGEAPDPSANIELGDCVVTGLPPGLPAGSKVQVRLSYGENGRVSVMALDMSGGRFAHAEIERNSGLTEKEIQQEKEFVSNLNIE